MNTQETRINKLPEVNGTIIIGVVSAFKNISALTQIQCDELTANINSAGWYPLVQLIDLFQKIEKGNSHIPQLFFQAGSAFIQAWYDHGGKEMNHGSMGQLRMQGDSEGLKLIYRGFNEDEIYTKIIDMDEKEGFATIETISPFPKDFARGVFYNASLMWGDMEWVEVDIKEWKVSDSTYKHLIKLQFKLQTGEKMNARVDKLLENIGPNVKVSDEVCVELLWKLKGIKAQHKIEQEINKFANKKLGEFLNREHEISKKLKKAKEETDAALIELKMAQSNLIQAEKMAALGVLTAGIGHEINNPMNFIAVGSSNLKSDLDDLFKTLEVLKDIPDSDELLKKRIEVLKESMGKNRYVDLLETIPKNLEAIDVGVKRTVSIVNGLLLYSRKDSEEKKLYDIHENIESALHLLNNKFNDQIDIIKKYDKSIEMFECYPGQLIQVFTNLLTNAADSIEDKGSITITTENKANEITISITDTGHGIEKDIEEKMFDPFFTTKEVGKGTGLGLSICHGIVQKHKGTITVLSQINKGTEFKIQLPKNTKLKK